MEVTAPSTELRLERDFGLEELFEDIVEREALNIFIWSQQEYLLDEMCETNEERVALFMWLREMGLTSQEISLRLRTLDGVSLVKRYYREVLKCDERGAVDQITSRSVGHAVVFLEAASA